jgi:hypothetical protein
MLPLRLGRRDFLIGAGVLGGLAISGKWLGPFAALADDELSDTPMGPFGPWSAPSPIAELASASNDFHPAVSKDGLSLFFTTDRFAFPLTQIVVAQREDIAALWQPPQIVDVLNSTGSNTGVPNFTPSRHVVYFQSNRPGGSGATDLWVSRRKDKNDDFGWQDPIPLPGDVNTDSSESAATHFEDFTGSARLYFARFAGTGTIGQPDQDFDIYVSPQNPDGSFGPGQIVSSLNAVAQAGDPPHTWSRDTRTAIRRDGQEMFITSNRHGGLSFSGLPVENLWVSTRMDTSTEDWSTPQLVDAVNSGYGDGGPALSWDATTMYFFSQRSASGKPGKRQLWMTTRTRL